jgi:hypothetical protein
MALDMLTFAQGETYAIFGEDCCLWVSKPGQVQTNIHKLIYQASQLREAATKECLSWLSWLVNILEPVVSILFLLAMVLALLMVRNQICFFLPPGHKVISDATM